MKEKLLKFIKDKFNIALIIVQALAVLSYLLSGLGVFFVMLFFSLEGAFFIVWASKIFYAINANKESQEIYSKLPYTELEKENLRKKNESINKNNKMVAIILLIMGIVLVFSVFSYIF